MQEETIIPESASRVATEDLAKGIAPTGFGTFELDLSTRDWEWSSQAAALFGMDVQKPERLTKWEQAVFPDDIPKIYAAIEAAEKSGSYSVEFRVRHPNGTLHWIAGKGQVLAGEGNSKRVLRGIYYDITDRKGLEARLLALNETLEARVTDVREEARTLEVLNSTGIAVAAELDLERLVQMVTDAGVELSNAQFGAFFIMFIRTLASPTLFTQFQVSREKHSQAFQCPAILRFLNPRFVAKVQCVQTIF